MKKHPKQKSRFKIHGSFASKAEAVRKERAVKGWIKETSVRGHRRYTVLTEW